MSKKIIVLILITVLSFLLSSCSEEPEIIKIGFSYELTGANSELGRDAMNGALLAVGEINSNGGINGAEVNLLIKDDKGNPITGVENDNLLIDEGCVAIIGHGTSNMGELTIKNANENNFILLSPTISSYIFENQDDNFFRMIPSNRTQGSGLGEFINTHTPGEVLIIIENQNKAFTETVAESLQTYLSTTESEYNDVIVRFNSNNNEEYESIVDLINSSSANNIVLIGSSYDVASIVQKGLTTEAKLYIPVWASTSNIFNLSGDGITNSHGINYYDLNSIEPLLLKFHDNYTTTYGLEPSFSSMFAYEAIYTLIEGLRNSTSFNTEDIKDALIGLPPKKWLIDEVSFAEYGEIERKLYWFHLIDGNFVEVIQ